MKRIEFTERGFRAVTYNPKSGWVAYIYDSYSSNSYFNPIVYIRGLENKDDALLKIGAEIRSLELQEIDPNNKFNGKTLNIDFKGDLKP